MKDIVRKSLELRGLTDREVDVADRLLQGHTDEQIAAELGILLRDARNDVLQVFAKTGFRSKDVRILAEIASKALDMLEEIADEPE